MYYKVEPTGCCVRKGMVQVRYAFYLEPGDYKYEAHHVKVPVIPDGGYPGEVGKDSRPEDREDYRAWLDSLPKEARDNPFHNHFVYFEPEVSDEEINDIGEAFLQEAYIKWALGERPMPENPPVKWPFINARQVQLCESRLERLRNG